MKNVSNILFVADFSQDNIAALRQAISLAQSNQARITVASHVGNLERVKGRVPISDKLVDAILEKRHEQLLSLVQSATGVEQEIETKLFKGAAFIDIIRDAIEFRRDLLIKPIERRNHISAALFGGTDMKLLRKCPCPVWLIKSTEQRGDREILVALDLEPDNPENDDLNMNIMDMATTLVLADFSALHVVNAWHLQYESFLRSDRVQNTKEEVDRMVADEENLHQKWLSKLIDESLAAYGKETTTYLKPQLHLLEGVASKVVPELSKKLGTELLVMGTVGRTGIPGYIMGNTAEAILEQVDCSVLAIKPDGFISPVELEKL